MNCVSQQFQLIILNASFLSAHVITYVCMFCWSIIMFIIITNNRNIVLCFPTVTCHLTHNGIGYESDNISNGNDIFSRV